MGLVRLLIAAALIYLVWRTAKRLIDAGKSARDADKGTTHEGTSERMLRCQQCGVHVPAHEAFSHQGLHFCSQEHLRLYLEHHDR